MTDPPYALNPPAGRDASQAIEGDAHLEQALRTSTGLTRRYLEEATRMREVRNSVILALHERVGWSVARLMKETGLSRTQINWLLRRATSNQ
jgi:hypothetical protein